MKKAELMSAAQEFSDASFSHAAEGSHYTAWSSMSSLIKKNLVSKEGNPARWNIFKILSLIFYSNRIKIHYSLQILNTQLDCFLVFPKSCTLINLEENHQSLVRIKGLVFEIY